MKRSFGPWAAFLACCFLVVGLIGLFASYAGTIPLERAISRLGVLREVRAAAAAADPGLQRFRERLADRAAPVLDGPGPLEPRIAAEEAAAAEQGLAEASAVEFRVRLLLLVVTAMAGAFGLGILRVATRS